jgi:hypothetical protein
MLRIHLRREAYLAQVRGAFKLHAFDAALGDRRQQNTRKERRYEHDENEGYESKAANLFPFYI